MIVENIPYKRYDIDKGSKTINALAEEAKKATSAKQLIEIRNKYLVEYNAIQTMGSLSSARFTCNTKDEFYKAENDYYDENSAGYNVACTNLIKAIIASPHYAEFKKQTNGQIIKAYEACPRIMDDKIVEESVEIAKTTSEYAQLMAGLLCEWEGEKIPRPKLMGYFKSPDREVREKAYNSLGAALEGISDKLDDIFDRLVKLRTRKARKMGFADFCEMGDLEIAHYDYDRAKVAAFREGVLKYAVPLTARIKKSIAESMGIKEMKLFDNDVYLNLNGGDSAPIYNAEQMFEQGAKMYKAMNPALDEFFRSMVDDHAFDYMPRDGKWGGGYMTYFNNFKQVFILANFNGTAMDTQVLTHEFGHAFAAKRVFDNNIDPEIGLGGMETAETHSMAMEVFCDKYSDLFYGKEGADKARFAHFADSLCFLPYGTMVDYFQECVYKNPDMTPSERNDLWKKLESEFRPYMNADGIRYLEKGTRWQYQMHIFENPFYYIDYCLAGTSAINFACLIDDTSYDKAFDKYLKLVDYAGTLPYDELLKTVGLPSPFDVNAFKTSMEKTEKLVQKLLKKVK